MVLFAKVIVRARGCSVVTAIILIEAEVGSIPSLATQLVEMDGVSEVFSVAGRYDLIVIVKVSRNDELANVISDKMRRLEGIVKTETLIAFRAYSNQELEIGMDFGLD